MSILDQSRGLAHIQGMPPGGQPILPPHPLEGPPNSDVLLALLARNKALEGEFSDALRTCLDMFRYLVLSLRLKGGFRIMGCCIGIIKLSDWFVVSIEAHKKLSNNLLFDYKLFLKSANSRFR